MWDIIIHMNEFTLQHEQDNPLLTLRQLFNGMWNIIIHMNEFTLQHEQDNRSYATGTRFSTIYVKSLTRRI